MADLIVSAEVGPMPKSMFDPMPSVRVFYADGRPEILFSFYPDEIGFAAEEFVGLTKEQALDLRHRKDVAYLKG